MSFTAPAERGRTQKLFDDKWEKFEKDFWTTEVRQGRLKRARSDHLIGHVVVAETAREVNIGKIATEYQRYARERAFPSVDSELDVLLKHASTYEAMERATPDVLTTRIASVLGLWDLSTFHPFVLATCALPIDEDAKETLFKLLESYIVRREICGLTTKSYNKVVIGFVKQIKPEHDIISAFDEHLAALTGDASRMPSDTEIVENFARRPVYGPIATPRLRFILSNLEYALRSRFDEVTVQTGNLHIEHVMPQRWSTNWPLPNEAREFVLTENAFDPAAQSLKPETKSLMIARQNAVNTFGNLSLLTEALNPSIGNAAWSIKRSKFRESLLRLNREIAASEDWSETEIETRARSLAKCANKIWPSTATAVRERAAAE